ncbi:DUF6950 family protein [Agrobacterium tumefaciens]|jgi:hypothetical protein|uniref:DUF6950 domain-containing protein n=1 Tax=Agrobacterium tumefaciens TaxID=358 RepID=A0AB36EIQ5_AGRTU|nr:hypothetical protein A6U91_06195 [Agrobacterium tumefaciens]
MNIHEFLALPHRFRWGGMGGDDCFTFPASWCLEHSGIDPASQFRGTYRTRDDARVLIAAHGGEVAFAERQLSAVNARRVQSPQDGDVGIVRMLAGENSSEMRLTLVGAVRFGPLWASISPAGVRATQADFVAAWRFLP